MIGAERRRPGAHLGPRSRAVHALFRAAVVAKFVDGVLEVIGGVALLFVNPAQVTGLMRALTWLEYQRVGTAAPR